MKRVTNPARSILKPRYYPYPLFFVLLIITLSACSSMQAVPVQTNGVLWKISNNELRPSYLFGTIHSEDPAVVALNESLLIRLRLADTLAVEVIPDPESLQYASKKMFFGNNQTLQGILPSALYTQTVHELSKHGINKDQANMMKPWAAATLLSMPPSETGLFLDMKLLQIANQQSKAVIALETMQEQIAVFDQLEMGMQIQILQATIDNLENNPLWIKQTIDAWLSQDLHQIETVGEEFFSDLPPATATELEKRLILNRNRNMAERIQPLLKTGNAFIAVGALHLTGEAGLINLLRKQGYSLEPVTTK